MNKWRQDRAGSHEGDFWCVGERLKRPVGSPVRLGDDQNKIYWNIFESRINKYRSASGDHGTGRGPLVSPALMIFSNLIRGVIIIFVPLAIALLGKMNGAFRFCVTGIMPFGAPFGGWLGNIIGIRWTSRSK